MCGIIGYIGNKEARKILLNGLSRLEYRGYDSAGIAVLEDKKLNIIKSIGRISNLELKVKNIKLASKIGIGHTRWATHGVPSDNNSHPHYNKDKTIAVVHNGIIENYQTLKADLISKGYIFNSETDSEVIAHLLDFNLEEDFLKTIKKTIDCLEGSYALGIINSKYPDTLYATRYDGPLLIGKGINESFIASDASAIIEYTKEVAYLNNKEIAVIKDNNITIYDSNLNIIKPHFETLSWSIDEASKMGYKHFMLKEILEQPDIINKTLNSHLKNDLANIEFNFDLKKISKIYIVACGTAYHAGLNVKHMIEKLLSINTIVEVASEFRYNEPLVDKNTLVIIISQSGETADTLAALRLSKELGAKVISIVNVVASSIARESNQVIYTWAGPEIAVASTKAFTTQLIVLYLLIIQMSLKTNKLTKKDAIELINELKSIPTKINNILDQKEDIKKIAHKTYKEKDVYFIGRGIDYYASLEASLKLKEISYIHADAYAAGELKHGSIALIKDNTLIIALCTNEYILPKMISNIKEVITRGAKTFIIANEDIEIGDYKIIIPETHNFFKTILSIITLQLYAYYTADHLGCDVDKPKNLAKSVTVE